MSDPHLQMQLQHVARRIGRLWLWRRLAMSWVVLSIIVLVFAVAGKASLPVWGWFAVAGTAVVLAWFRSRTRASAQVEVARKIESAFPDLNSRLLAALEQRPDAETGRLNILQKQVILEAVRHARFHDWGEAVSDRQLRKAFLGQTLALFAFAAVALCAMQLSSRSAAALSKSGSHVAVNSSEVPVAVEPGNAEVERGTSVLVLARFSGRVPADVHVVTKSADGIEQRIPLTKSLDDPVFATRLPPMKEETRYQVDFDGQQSEEYKITLFDLPALVRSDLKLEYPEYTHQPATTLEDAFDVTAVEGTKITCVCRINKELASAKLVSGDGVSLELQADSSAPTTYRVQFAPTQRMRVKLELVDQQGRKNRDPEEFRFDVVPNRPPELTLSFPGKDVKVSPLEEIHIEASTIDDFGIVETGLVLQVGSGDELILPLGKDLKGAELHKLASVERLEEFKALPDELVSYYLYAVDYGPDGQKRQTNSDMFFAEVRPFEEIFRQNDQQSPIELESQQKEPDSLAKLIELQRQIIVATWKQMRSTTAKWTNNSAKDLGTIRDSQKKAHEKLEGFREKMNQPQLQPVFASIDAAMQKALAHLGRSIESQKLDPLRPAVGAEQGAYQGLLKLRSKEHMMMMARGKGNSGESEEKLDLEMKSQKDRYESEKAGAKKEESNINRESLAILDRLKDLARRQDGVNQQMKELEAQIRQAKTDAEREDAQRQLKRLREEQQQLLHDADELRNRLNQSLQQENVARTKEQLEQTRQRMVDTAEKLREGQVSQALNSGTRAERELKELSDDFRQQTAAQFAEAMRDLREDVRRLAENEAKLSKSLTELGDTTRRTLRESQERTQLQNEFQQQRAQAAGVVDKAKKVVEQAESSEPLLAKQLYDTLRSSRDRKLDQALDATQQLLRRGIIPEAARAEQQAQSAIDSLKQGIEKAAESVLGNEVDSLKRARRELAQLSESLGNELKEKTGEGSPNAGSRPAADGEPSKEGQQPGDGAPSDAQSQSSLTDANSEKDGAQGNSGKGQKPGEQGTPGQSEGNSGQNGDASGDATDGRGSGGSSEGGGSASQGQSEQQRLADRKGPADLRGRKKSTGSRPSNNRNNQNNEDGGGGGSAGNSQGGGPITGDSFSDFNERLRDIESMVSDPQLQSEVQKVRDRARSVRAEFKRHSNTPNWDLVRTSVHQPMLELQQRLADEIAKRESPDSLVPVDRDPIPTKYRDLVRNYYEGLGTGDSKESRKP